MPKYLYDTRSDAAALRSRPWGVSLRGVVDLQLADAAVRQAGGEGGQWVSGLPVALKRWLTVEPARTGGWVGAGPPCPPCPPWRPPPFSPHLASLPS